MNNWIQVKGVVVQGYGVASGQSQDTRFPQGTIALQKPFFRDRGLELDNYFSGTLNVSISPVRYEIKSARYLFRNLKWAADSPAEDFSFFDCRIHLSYGIILEGLIYYPHPETKPEHFQPPDLLEIMAPYISQLKYGDELMLEVKPQQMNLVINEQL